MCVCVRARVCMCGNKNLRQRSENRSLNLLSLLGSLRSGRNAFFDLFLGSFVDNFLNFFGGGFLVLALFRVLLRTTPLGLGSDLF